MMRVINLLKIYFSNLAYLEKVVFVMLIGLSSVLAILNSVCNTLELTIDSNAFLTIISIFIGFNITVISIMALADYSKELYKYEIKTAQGTTTLFHKLIIYYKGQIYFSIFMLFVLLLIGILTISNPIVDNIIVFLLIIWIAVSIFTLKYTFAFIVKQVSHFQ